MSAGQFSLHHINLAHASAPNCSSDRRIGVAVRYMPPRTATVNEQDVAMLVRGVDVYGHFSHMDSPPELIGPEAAEAQHQRALRIKHENTMRGHDAAKLQRKSELARERVRPAHVARL